MVYIPQDSNIYLAAFTGALSGMALSDKTPTSTDPLSYDQQGQIAVAFAQAFDTVAGPQSPPYVSFLGQFVTSLCEAAWQERCPSFSPESIDPASYIPLAQTILAIGQGGLNALFTAGPIPGIQLVGQVGITSADQILDYLQSKLVAGTGVVLTVQNPGLNETLKIDAGGAVAPFTEVYYTDPNTAVLPVDQTGSVAAPYSTIQAAVNAAVAALQTTFSIIMTATAYPETVVVPGGVAIALVTEGVAVLNSLQISASSTVLSTRGQIGVVTLILDGPTSQFVGYVTTSLGTVTLNDQCVIRLTGEFTSGNVTAGPLDTGTLIYSCSDVNAELVGINNTSALGLINTPNMDVQVSGCLVEHGIAANSGVFSHCIINPDGNLTFAGKCEISDCQFGFVAAPYTLTLSAQGAILKDCDFPGVGANLTIDNTAGLLAMDPYTFARFITSGVIITTPANLAIIGQLTTRIVGAAFAVPLLAAGGKVSITIPAPGVQAIEQIVVNGTNPIGDVFPILAVCTAVNTVTVLFQTVAGYAGGIVTLDIFHTFPTSA